MTTLHALATDTTLHADAWGGESTITLVEVTLTDEDGDTLVDENGDTLVVMEAQAVPVLHAGATDTTLHAGEDDG